MAVCRHGHRLEGDNVVITKDCGRERKTCRECRKRWGRKTYANKERQREAGIPLVSPQEREPARRRTAR